MTYTLRNIRDNCLGYQRLGNLSEQTFDLFADRLTINMSECKFFDAHMTSPLGAILGQLTDWFNLVRIVNLHVNIEENLRKNGFLALYGYRPLPDVDQTTMRFRRVHLSDTGEFIEYIFHQIEENDRLEMPYATKRLFLKKVFEVFNNAVVHSDSKRGVFVCGQYDPTRECVCFTITDGGIGIRGSVRKYFNNNKIKSIPALRWALKSKNTTREIGTLGGLGFQQIQRFTHLDGGSVRIVSRRAFYEYSQGLEMFQELSADFPGTAVTIEVNIAT